MKNNQVLLIIGIAICLTTLTSHTNKIARPFTFQYCDTNYKISIASTKKIKIKSVMQNPHEDSGVKVCTQYELKGLAKKNDIILILYSEQEKQLFHNSLNLLKSSSTLQNYQRTEMNFENNSLEIESYKLNSNTGNDINYYYTVYKKIHTFEADMFIALSLISKYDNINNEILLNLVKNIDLKKTN